MTQKSILSTTYAAFLYLLATSFLVYEMTVLVSPAVISEHLMRHFSIDAAALGLLSSSFFYAYTAMQIPGGILMDRYDIRYVISLAIASTVLGTWLFSLLLNPYSTAFARFMIGLGGALAFVGALTVARQRFSPERFDLMAGTTQLIAALGALFGSEPLARLSENIGWRQMLDGFAVVGLGVLVIFFLVARDNRTRTERECAGSWRNRLDEFITLMKSTKNHLLGAYAFLNWGPIFIFAALWGIPYFKATLGIDGTHAAHDLSFCWLGNAIASPSVGWIANRFHCHRGLLKFGPLLGLLASMALLTLSSTTPEWVVVAIMMAIGASSASHILIFGITCDNNPASVSSTALAFVNMAVVAGGALLQPLAGFVLSYVGSGEIVRGVPIYSAHDYKVAMAILPICYAANVLLGLIVSQFHKRK